MADGQLVKILDNTRCLPIESRLTEGVFLTQPPSGGPRESVWPSVPHYDFNIGRRFAAYHSGLY